LKVNSTSDQVSRKTRGRKQATTGRTLDESGEDTSGGLDTGRERSDIEEEEILGLLRGVTGKDGGLDGSSVSDGLVGVDRPVGLLAGEKVGDELLDLRDSSGSTDEDDLVNGGLVHLGVLEDL
jgi:hypothetical protein